MNTNTNHSSIPQADTPVKKSCEHKRITTIPDPLGQGNIRIFCMDCGVDVMKLNKQASSSQPG